MRSLVVSLLVFRLLISASIVFGAPNPDVQVPPQLIEKAAQYVARSMGRELFRESVSFAGGDTLDMGRNSFVVYFEYSPSETPRASISLPIRVDESRPCSVLEDRVIPNCMKNPRFCEVTVSKDQAIEIARRNGLEQGLGEWVSELRTMNGWSGIVWAVTARMQKTDEHIVGKTGVINAYNGQFLDTLVEYHLN